MAGEQDARAKAKAQAEEEMAMVGQTIGGQRLMRTIEARVAQAVRSLTDGTFTDLGQVVRLQEQIRTYRAVLKAIQPREDRE